MWVQRVVTDNGSWYRSGRFRRALERLEVRHIFTRPYRPQTNGKAERFIQTAKRDWAYKRAYCNAAARTLALRSFLNRYNGRRPHHGLDRQTPLSRLEALVGTTSLVATPRAGALTHAMRRRPALPYSLAEGVLGNTPSERRFNLLNCSLVQEDHHDKARYGS